MSFILQWFAALLNDHGSCMVPVFSCLWWKIWTWEDTRGLFVYVYLCVDHTVVILILMVMVMTKNKSYFKTTDKSMSKRCGPKPRRYVWTTTVIFWDTMQTRSSSLINNYILWTGRRPNLEQFVILLLNGFTNLPLWSFESKTRFFLLFSDNPAFAIIPPSTYPDLDPCSRGPQHKKNRSDPVPRSLKGGLCKV